MGMLDLEALRRADVGHDPCEFVVVPAFVRPEHLDAVNREYPPIGGPGNFPAHTLTYGPAFGALLEELGAPELRRIFAEKFAIDLEGFPLQVTVRKFSEPSDGAIHNDSRTKVVTVLVYLNEAWPHEGGRLRLLRSPRRLEDFAVEVVPAGGTLLAFKRSERSYHGFVPCVAERRSIQMYWVRPKRQGRDETRTGTWKKRLKRLLKRG